MVRAIEKGGTKSEPALAGERLFAQYGCMACHGQRGPTMAGLVFAQFGAGWVFTIRQGRTCGQQTR